MIAGTLSVTWPRGDIDKIKQVNQLEVKTELPLSESETNAQPSSGIKTESRSWILYRGISRTSQSDEHPRTFEYFLMDGSGNNLQFLVTGNSLATLPI